MKKLLALLNTPARAVIAVGLIILIAESLIMALIVSMHNIIFYDEVMENIVAGIIDPILLVAIVAPALYILIFRPMRDQQAELDVAHKKVKSAFHEWMAALDVIDDPIFLHDKQFRILRCNKAYQQRAGIPFPEIIGQPYYEVFPKAAAPLPCCLRALEKEEAEEEMTVGDTIYRLRAFSVHDEQGAYLYSVHTLEDITERKHQEERTAALLELSTSVETLDEKTLLQQGLDTVQHLTDSRIGFLHFVSEDQKEIELVTWSTDTLAHYCQAAFDRHYPLSAAGIWVDSVLLKQPVIINDYATAPGKKGLPEGHAAVQRFICVPVLEGTQVRMIVGVGNAARNYDEHDVETVKLFSYDLYHFVQRKRAIKSLEENEQHFRAVTESANDAIITAADAGNIIGWNAAAGRLFGYTETEIIGQPLTVLMPERFRSAHSAGLARVVAGGAPHVIDKTVELAGLRKDGSEFPLEFSLAQWQAVEGQFFTAIIRDITERKGAEQTLIKSEALLNEMGRLAKVGGWEFNVETREVVWTEEVYRIHELDMAYKPTVDKGIEFYAPASRSIIAKVVQRAIEYGEPYDVELELITAKGNYRWVHTTGKVFQKHGKTITVFGTFQDITERKQAEAQLLEQLDDLRRWHDATIGREMRVLDLKHEVNELLVHTGQPPRYPSAESDNQQEK